MTNKQFNLYYKRYESVIQAIARKYAASDQDLFDDLMQVATIGLYEADLRRPYKNEDAFLRQVIRNKVIDHLRWLDHKRFDRLDQRLAQGDQVIRDQETGEVTFVHFSPRKDNKITERPAPDRLPTEDEDYE
jgi:RNA polymerase sigma factor (sigma-70 family)